MAAAFGSAVLLFSAETFFTKLLLPLLGGAPSVWNASVFFYELLVLAAYGYVHWSTTLLGVRRQLLLHVALLSAAFAFLPLHLHAGAAPPQDAAPIPWLLLTLTSAVAAPLLLIASSGPLLQSCFSSTDHPVARNPYFIYSASNAGSMAILIAYPVIIEPFLTLSRQAHIWTWCYGAEVLLVCACGAFVVSSRRSAAGTPSTGAGGVPSQRSMPTALNRTEWVLLAFLPSSLSLGVTTYISSDIAVIPLLWVLPLAIYLLTFAMAFARHPLVAISTLVRFWPICVLAVCITLLGNATLPAALTIVLHLSALFVAALLCHSYLSAARPSVDGLTEFYVWVALGGLLGGAFNSLIAPHLFNSVAEYPLVLAAICFLPAVKGGIKIASSWRVAAAMAVFCAVLTAAAGLSAEHLPATTSVSFRFVAFGIPALVCYFLSRRPLAYAACVAALLGVGGLFPATGSHVLFSARNFFGINEVTADAAGKYHMLVNGITLHGMQSLSPERRREPLTYYHPTGPAGDVFARYGGSPGLRVGVIGLGAGSLAAYAKPGQFWTFFEIDPAVVAIARDDNYFTFLKDSPAITEIIVGDGRLSLQRSLSERFDILVVDAFSSDVIPVHLATFEALSLYAKRLSPHGTLLFHISNLHLDLEPVLTRVAEEAGFNCLTREDTDQALISAIPGKSPSVWMAMARDRADLARLAADIRWRESRADSSQPPWTDDYSSIIRVLHWW
jgi:hypothetical protein